MTDIPIEDKPDPLKIPAFMRKKSIVNHARQKLLWTALDRREAGVKPGSKKALGTSTVSRPNNITRAQIEVPDSPKTLGTAPRKAVRGMPTFSSPPSALALPAATSNMTQAINKPKKLSPAGTVTHYLDKINVAIIKLNKTVKTGDILIIQGSNCLFYQPVTEMQIERKPVERARKGDHIGLKVGFTSRIDGQVYLA
jgi:hypothetical protein